MNLGVKQNHELNRGLTRSRNQEHRDTRVGGYKYTGATQKLLSSYWCTVVDENPRQTEEGKAAPLTTKPSDARKETPCHCCHSSLVSFHKRNNRDKSGQVKLERDGLCLPTTLLLPHCYRSITHESQRARTKSEGSKSKCAKCAV